MDDVLKVGSAIRLLSTDYSKEVEELKQAVKTISRVNKEKVSINNALKSSFSNVTKTFKDRDITFKGLFLDHKELEDYLVTLKEEISSLEQEKVEMQQKQVKYSNNFDLGYGQTYFDAEGTQELEDNNKRFEELNNAIEEKKKDLDELTVTVETIKNLDEEERFEYLVKMYYNHKDEIIEKINEIDEVVVRVNVKKEFESIEDLIAGKKENEKKQEEAYKKIEEVSKKLGVSLVYENGKKGRVTKKEEKIVANLNGEVPEQPAVSEFTLPVSEEPVVPEFTLPVDNELGTDEVGFERNDENPFKGFVPDNVTSPSLNEIHNIEDLVSEIKRLNPDRDIDFDMEKEIAINIDFPPQFLVLPIEQDFRYVEGIGITNKKDDRTPYIVLPVIEKRNQELSEEPAIVEEPVVDMPVIDEQPVRVPGSRYKVKKVASAIIDKHAKAIFHGAALSSIALGIAGITLGPGGVLLAAGAGFVSGGLLSETIDKLYQKIIGNSNEKVEELENNDKNEELTVEKTNRLLEGLKKLSKIYPRIKRGQHEKRRWADELNNIDESDLLSDEFAAGRGM